MKITTIQIYKNVKSELDKLKKSKESYGDIIHALVNESKLKKKEREALLVEGYKKMAKENMQITKEFEFADAEIDWEWNENKKG